MSEPQRRGGLRQIVRDLVYGMTTFEFNRHAVEMRAGLETIFLAVTIGDMVGLPIIPPYYSLRLLPYVAPEIATWKRRILRERGFTEEHEFDLHGL